MGFLEQKHVKSIIGSFFDTLPYLILGLIALGIVLATGVTKEDPNGYVYVLIMTLGIYSLLFSWSYGKRLGEEYDLYGVSTGQVGALGLLMSVIVVVEAGYQIPVLNTSIIVLPIAIILSTISVWIYYIIDKSGFKITMPEGVPTSVAKSFEALIPYGIVIFLGAVYMYVRVFLFI